MKPSGIITLITDFGLRDWYVGAMKGVILGVNPAASIVDITHDIAPGDVTGAAFALRGSYRCFPSGTVHVVVVDPGVGGERKILLAESNRHLFLAPDNGILSGAIGSDALRSVRSVERSRFWRRSISDTFHGRDIFAPVAAHLSKGEPPARMGPACKKNVALNFPMPNFLNGNLLRAEVMHVDRFGNLITNIGEDMPILREGIAIRIRGREIKGVSRSYDSVRKGELLAICGSSGYLEISVNGGDASRKLGARRGTTLSVKRIERKR